MADYVLPSDRDQPAPQTAPGNYTLPSDKAAPKPPSTWYDTAMSALAGIPKGAMSLFGMPRDLSDMETAAGAWLARKMGATPQAAQQSAQRARSGTMDLASMLPSSQDIIDTANSIARRVSGHELYAPQTAPGRIAQTVTSALPSAAIGSEGSVAANLAHNLPVATGSATGQALAQEAAGNDSPYATVAGIVGGLAGGIGAGGAQALLRARSAPVAATRAANVAGQALREGYADPVAAAANLRAYTSKPPALLPGVTPTTAQVVGTGEAQGLENQIAGLTGNAGSPEIAALRNAKDYSLQQVERGVAFDPQTGAIDLSKAIGTRMPQVSPVTIAKEPPIGDVNDATRSALGIDEGEQGAHAARAKDALAKIEEHYAGQAQQAWNKLDATGAELNTEPVIASARNYLDNLDEADKPYFPADIKRTLDSLETKFSSRPPKPFTVPLGGHFEGATATFDPVSGQWTSAGQPVTSTVAQVLNAQFPEATAPAGVGSTPLRQFQGLRRNVLADARAKQETDPNAARVLNGLANNLGESLTTKENYTLAGDEAPQAWADAVAATRQHKQLFGEGFPADALETTQTGAPKMAGDAFFEQLFKGGSNAGERLRQLQSIPGIDSNSINDAVSDWMVGKLSKNGTKLDFTPDQVNQFANNPANKTIIDQVPGLSDRFDALQSAAQDRLDTLAQHSEAYKTDVARNADEQAAYDKAQKLSDNFQSTFNNSTPAKLADFIAANRDDLKATMPPEQAAFLDQLEDSARYVSKLPSGAANATRTLQALKNGTLFSLIYGKAAGAVTDAAAGEVIGDILGASHVPGIGHVGAALGLLGYGKRMLAPIERGVSSLILGDTRDDAIKMLQLAAANPELAQELMQKPSPEAFTGVLGALKAAGKGAVKMGAKSAAYQVARPPYPANPPKAPEPAFVDLPDGNFPVPVENEMEPAIQSVPEMRPQRKSGGRVQSDIDRMAKALIAKAKKAKKESDETTKPLLKVDDEVIAKALHVANRVRGQ